MKTKLIIGSFILMIFFTIGNALMYFNYKDKTIKLVKEKEKMEIEINTENQSKAVEESLVGTYSDILIMMKLEPRFKISKFDKSDSSSGRIFITIESSENRKNIREDLDGIIQMKNFVSLKNISIKGESITINVEFKMNYK